MTGDRTKNVLTYEMEAWPYGVKMEELEVVKDMVKTVFFVRDNNFHLQVETLKLKAFCFKSIEGGKTEVTTSFVSGKEMIAHSK